MPIIERAADDKKFDAVRQRFYGCVLVFAVTSAVLLTAVPVVNARLFDRIQIIKTAMTGEAQSDIINTGENDIPYPEEFMRPASSAVVSRPPAEPARRPATAQITPPVLIGTTGYENPAEVYEDDEDDEDDDAPRFLQGDIEREAYEKTLEANEKLAAIVMNGNQVLSFKTWGAARRHGNVYWVRLIFQNESGADVEYIWQTDITSGSVSPLNFNARSF